MKDFINNKGMENLVEKVIYRIHKAENISQLLNEIRKIEFYIEACEKAFEFGLDLVDAYMDHFYKIKGKDDL